MQKSWILWKLRALSQLWSLNIPLISVLWTYCQLAVIKCLQKSPEKFPKNLTIFFYSTIFVIKKYCLNGYPLITLWIILLSLIGSCNGLQHGYCSVIIEQLLIVLVVLGYLDTYKQIVYSKHVYHVGRYAAHRKKGIEMRKGNSNV